MKRIGTTTQGGALIEFDAAEVSTIQQALDLLGGIVADVPAETPAPPRVIIIPPAPKPAKPAPKPASKKAAPSMAADGQPGTRICNTCWAQKPADAFYTGHGKCKECFKAHAAKKKAAASGGEAPKPRTNSKGYLIRKPDAPLKAASMTKEQRLEAIKEAARRVRERDELDLPRDPSGRAMQVGGEG